MASLADQILAYAAELPEDEPLQARGLLDLGTLAAVNRALAQLAQAQALIRVSRGIYLLALTSRFGRRIPSSLTIVRAVGRATGEVIAVDGAVAAFRLGLTTQAPLTAIYLSSDRSRRLNVAGRAVELRHAPGWKLLMPDQVAGDACAPWPGSDLNMLATHWRSLLRVCPTSTASRCWGCGSACRTGWSSWCPACIMPAPQWPLAIVLVSGRGFSAHHPLGPAHLTQGRRGPDRRADQAASRQSTHRGQALA